MTIALSLADGQLTAREMITTAMQELGVLASGESPEANEMADGIKRLNGMLKSFEVRGYSLWRTSTAPVNIAADAASTVLSGDVYDVEAARFVTSSTNERPLTMFEKDDYKILPNKTQNGNPSIYYVDRQKDSVVLYLWPVPATAGVVNIDYLRRIDVVTDPADYLDIPANWQETIYTLLAVRMAPMFGTQIRPDLLARAQELEAEMDAQDRPTSYFMGPFD